ncbi:MAG: hypothetical protein ABJE66_11560 [Deltaproteobacteria bacterium]
MIGVKDPDHLLRWLGVLRSHLGKHHVLLHREVAQQVSPELAIRTVIDALRISERSCQERVEPRVIIGQVVVDRQQRPRA